LLRCCVVAFAIRRDPVGKGGRRARARHESIASRGRRLVLTPSVHGSTADHFVRLSGVRLQPAEPSGPAGRHVIVVFHSECSAHDFGRAFIRSRTTCRTPNRMFTPPHRYRISARASARLLAAAPTSGRNGGVMFKVVVCVSTKKTSEKRHGRNGQTCEKSTLGICWECFSESLA